MKNKFNTYFPSNICFIHYLLAILFLGAHFVAYSTFHLSGVKTLTLGIYALIWVILSLFTRDYKVGRAVGFYYTFQKHSQVFSYLFRLFRFLWVFVENNQIDRHSRSHLSCSFLSGSPFIEPQSIWCLDRYRTFGGNIRKFI